MWLNMNIFKNLYDYRELLKCNIKKEIRGKYKASFLGVLWSFINPLLTVLVYALVFPYILRVQQENYLIFLIVAIIPWNFFTLSINQGTTSVFNNSNMIKKVYFPREILPISFVTSCLINFFISCIIIVIFVLASGIGLSIYILFLPLIAIIEYFLALGIVFILSAVEMYVRDIEYIVGFLLTLLFYATPILYNAEMFPNKIKWILSLNPMTTIINSYRDIFLYQQMPIIKNLLIILLFSMFLMVLGYLIFKKLEKNFAEQV